MSYNTINDFFLVQYFIFSSSLYVIIKLSIVRLNKSSIKKKYIYSESQEYSVGY